MSLRNIFQKPIFVESFGNVYPVQLRNWDDFELNLNPILLSKSHISVNTEEDIPLLDRLVLGLQDQKLLISMCKIFNIISRTDSFDLFSNEKEYWFSNEEGQRIDSTNYDQIRNIAFNQNILFEPKIYKNPVVQQWAERVLKARSKNAANITMEDMITTVAVCSGKHYWELEQYSVYQLKSEFQRINRIKVYDSTSIMFANPYASDIHITHFAENNDLYEDPYKDVFKTKDKMNISKAIQG